jgi:hypothetical protein
MATTSTLRSVTGSADWQFQDTVTQVYLVLYDSVPTNFHTALALAQTATGSPVPSRGAHYGNGLYALAISGEPTSEARLGWLWTVNFTVPPQDETGGSVPEPNPLLRPLVYNVEYMDREYVIQKAKNVEALSHGDGKGGNRAASTLGPIVNAAGKKPDEPQVDTERIEVLKIWKYYPSLAAIVTRNRTYKRTTNSDSVQGYSARQLRYLLTESEGLQVINGYEVWRGVTSILAEDTTDLILDNVGYDYWDAGDADWKKAVDANGEPMADPINLKLDGDKGGDNSTTITYRHLEPVAYASLFT